MSDNLAALLAAVVGLGLALALGRAFLATVLRATFRRARTFVRRLVDRRGRPRPGPDRRQAERRH
ncbi:MAG TPA: hypothetical protein VFO85_04345 [Vicinamibacteria bacterium]|nr:hypothetical protein [Vicinamibacteria bacterium]